MRWNNISIEELDNYVGNSRFMIIDVRNKEEYNLFHIKGAINYHYSEMFENGNRMAIQNFVKTLAGRTPIIYCDRGGSSMRFSKKLLENGINCINVVGGILKYNGKNGIKNTNELGKY